ncbi:hypothetical protein Tco_0080124 [Tanacetum coccineum]
MTQQDEEDGNQSIPMNLTFFIEQRLMMGRELEGLSYKELDNLERQLYDGMLDVKNRKIYEFKREGSCRGAVVDGRCLSENQESLDLTCRIVAEMQSTHKEHLYGMVSKDSVWMREYG